MKAVNNYVVVDKIKTTEKKIGGLIMTDVEEGETVYYDKHAGHGVEFNDKLYFVIRASDIVLVD
jgi:co-chaperonin GroES (HSP10)